MPSPTTIVAVTSLAREALVARGNGVSVVCSQGARLGAALHAAIHPGVSGIISFGISGGLHPELVAGDWIVASAVRYRDRVIETDSKWRHELSKRLPGAVLADIVGSDAMVPTPSEKSHLHLMRSGDFRREMRFHIDGERACRECARDESDGHERGGDGAGPVLTGWVRPDRPGGDRDRATCHGWHG